MSINDVAIIGAGPAGLSAAIQLKRYGVDPVLLEKEDIGGLLKNANLVENYPGFPNGISGPKLIELFEEQLRSSMVSVHFEEVLELDHKDGVFSVNTDKRTMACRVAIVASGTRACRLSNIKISKDIADLVLYEIHPLVHVENKRIAIVGSGDIAFDYALNISQKNEVIILNRGEKLKCLPLLWERARESAKITYKDTTEVKEINYRDSGLMLTCFSSSGEWQIHVSYLVVAIGRESALGFLGNNVVKSLDELQKAKLLYMVGDVKNDIYRQTAIAVGDGIRSAMEIHRKIEGESCG